MNFVFIDNRDYGKSAAELFELDFPKSKTLFMGGPREESEAFLKAFKPTKGDKTIVITAGTIDSDRESPGDAFFLVSDWITELPKDEFDPKDLVVIANPGFENRLSDAFFPFQTLKETCGQRHISLKTNIKSEGPEKLLKTIKKISDEYHLAKEGDRPGRRK